MMSEFIAAIIACGIGLAMVVLVLKLNNNKCKFFEECDFVDSKSYTCNHQHEACSYCGKYEYNESK